MFPFFLKLIFISFIFNLLLTGCGPGIPLTPPNQIIQIESLSEDTNLTLNLSNPSITYVNSNTNAVTFQLTLSRALKNSLNLNQITVVKTGTADSILAISGDGTQYTITLSSFTGDGTLSLTFHIGITTYSFGAKNIVVDNTNPLQTESITLPSSPVTINSADFSWDEVVDNGPITYQFKICTQNDCSTNCTTPIETEDLTATVENLTNGTYYACVQSIDLTANRSEFKPSSTSFNVALTSLTLLPNLITLFSPSSGVTSNDATPIITGIGLDPSAIFSLYSDINCSNLLSSKTVEQDGTIAFNSLTVSSEGTVHFYGKVTLEEDSTSCIDLQKQYLLDITPSLPQSLSNLTLSSPNNGVTSNDLTPIITGNGTDNDLISIFNESGCTTQIETTTIASSSFSINISSYSSLVDDGNKHFYAKLTDSAGNQSNCFDLNLSYQLDTTPPSDPTSWVFVSPTNGTTSNNVTPSITKSGLTSENQSTIYIYDDVSCTTSIGNSTISGGSFTTNSINYANDGTDDGDKTFYGKIVDVAGNSSNCVSLALSYSLDSVKPNDPSGWILNGPISGVTSNDTTPVIDGNSLASENGGTVLIFESAGCSNGSIGSSTIAGGIFSVNNISYLNDGTQDGIITFFGIIEDIAGNSSDCVNLNIGYKLDTVTPASPSGWTMSSPNSGTTSNDFTPQITGSGLNSEDGGSVSIYETAGCASPVGTASISGGSFTVSNIAYLNNGTQDGSKTYYGKITDSGGNSSPCISLSLSYLLDTTTPDNPSGFTMSSPNNGTTSNDHTPQISGSGLNDENGGSVVIYDDPSCVDVMGTATIGGGIFTVTNLSYAVDGSDDGSKTFYGKIVDLAGNSSSCVNLSLNYLFDHTVPSDPIGWTMSSPDSGETSNDTTPQITGSGLNNENGGTATLYDAPACSDSIGTATISGGSFTVSNISFLNNGTQDGSISFYGKVTDPAGNDSSCIDLNLVYLLDTTAPTDPSGWTISSPSNGSTTNDITPQISGAGLATENGSRVDIYDNVACLNIIGTETISGGSFTVSDITYLNNGTQDGTKTFYGKITDISGNSSSCVALSLSYLLDTTPPSNPSGWTMASPNTATTSNDITPEISKGGIVGENGASATIFDSSNCLIPIGSATVTTGSFTVSNITYLSDGSNDGNLSFYGKLTDTAGNNSTCVNLNLGYKLDTIPPNDPVGWSFVNVTNGETSGLFTPQISGAGLAVENKSVVSVYLTGACGVSVGSATINAGVFTITNISFADDGSGDGIKDFYGKITDAGGNASNCTDLTLSYELDTSMPSVSISTPTSSSFINNANKGAFTISGECSEGGRAVTVNATGGLSSTPNCTGTTWTTNLDFSGVGDGAITITADHNNAALTPAPQASVTLTKDADVPDNPSGWSLGSPADGVTSNDYTPQISGGGLAAENGGTVHIYLTAGCAISVGTEEIAGGTFTVSDITFASDGSVDGSKTFYGKLTDLAGNSSACTDLGLSYLLDTTLPANPSGLTMNSPNTGVTSNDATPQIGTTGLVGEEESTIFIYDSADCNSSIGSAVVSGGNLTISNITYLNNGTQDGSKLFYGKMVDAGNNSSSCVSLSLGYKLDTIVPNNPTGWTISSPSNGITSSDNSPQILGSGLTSENGGTVTIYDAALCSSVKGTATIAGGVFAVSNISYLTNGTEDGTKTFYGKITDSGGNESSCIALNLSYLFDTIKPSNPTGWTMSSPNSGTTSNDYTPLISGNGLAAENGSTVTIHSTGACASAIGSSTIAGGTFTVSNISYLNNGSQDGTKSFYGLITDSGGNSSDCTSLNLSYLLDTTNPSNPTGWTMSSPNSGTTSSDATPQISGTNLSSENGATITVYSNSDCSSSVGTATVSSDQFIINNITYASNGTQDGTKRFYGKITDTAGNTTPTCSNLNLEYLLDTVVPNNATSLIWTTTSPSVSSTTVTASWTKSNSLDLSNQKIQFYSDSSCSSTTGSLIDVGLNATQNFTGATGHYSYKVTSYDSAGNNSTSACSSVMDILEASLTNSTLAVSSSSIQKNQTSTITLTVKNASNVQNSFGGLTVTFSASGGAGVSTGTISGTTDNNNGVYTATFTATGKGTATTITASISGVGNVNQTKTITVTNTAPTLTLLSDSLYPLNSGNPPLIQGSSYNIIASTNDIDTGDSVTVSTCTYKTLNLNASDPNYATAGTACTSLDTVGTTNGTTVVKKMALGSSSLSWTPTTTQRGTYQFTITVSDGTNSSSSATGTYTVRDNFTTTHLLSALDGLFADNASTLPNSTPSAPYTTSSGTTDWLNLLGTANDGILTYGSTNPWSGTGQYSNYYRNKISSTNHDSINLGAILNGQSKIAISTWLQPNSSSTSSIIAGNGGGSGNGFALKQTGATYQATVLSDSPMLYWRLGEISGTTVYDISGNGNHGTYVGGYTLNQNSPLINDSDGSVTFDGSTGYIATTTAGSFANWAPSQFSVEWWLYPLNCVQWNQSLGPGWGSFGFHTTPYCSVYAGVTATPGEANRLTPNEIPSDTLTLNSWQYFVFTFDNGTAKFYKNGVLVATKSGLMSPTGPWNSFRTYASSGASINGSLDEVAVYSTTLSDTQIANHYKSAMGPTKAEFIVGQKYYSYKDLILSDKPVGYWRLGETSGTSANDLAYPNVTGTYASGITLNQTGALAGDSNPSASFNGAVSLVTTRVNLGNHSAGNFGTGDFSAEIWFKTSSNKNMPLLSKREICGHSNFWELRIGSGIIYAAVDQDTSGTNFGYYASTNTYIDNSWHHVVATRTGTTISIYVDGVLDTTAVLVPAGIASLSNTNNLLIGGSPCDTATNATTFNGQLDEPAIYNYALTSTQITEHYQTGKNGNYKAYPGNKILADKPISYWRLNEISGNIAYDIAESDNNNGVYQGTVTLNQTGSLTNTGDSDTSALLDGATGYISTSKQYTNPTSYTLEAWIKTTTTSGGKIVGFEDVQVGLASTRDRMLYMGNDGKINYQVYDSAPEGLITTNAYNDGLWHQVVVSQSSLFGASLYLDGNLVAQSSTVASTVNYSGWWKIGYGRLDGGYPNPPTSSYFQGTVDEVAIYDYPLNATQVSNHYNSGNGPGWWTCQSKSSLMSTQWNFISSLYDGTTAKLFFNGTVQCSVTPGTTYTGGSNVIIGANVSQNGGYWDGTIAGSSLFGTSDGSSVATQTTLQNDFISTANRFRQKPIENIVTHGLALHFDATNAHQGVTNNHSGCFNNDLTWFDLGSNSYNGTLVNFSSCSATGWSGSGSASNPYSLIFDGTNDYVKLPSSNTIDFSTNGFTIEVWSNFTSTSDWGRFVDFSNGAASDNIVFGRYQTSTSLGLAVYRGATPGNPSSSANAITNNVWGHYVVTVTPTTATAATANFYTNGNAFGSAGTNRPNIITRQLNYIAKSAWGGPYFQGQIGIIRIYTRPLTQQEIKQNCLAQESRFTSTPQSICTAP